VVEGKGASMSDEDYLAALLGLEEDAVALIQARLAERLGVSPAAVSEAVHRLVRRGFLEAGERSLHLTAAGRKVAASVVRRHRLAECLLVDVLGLAWEKVHHEAVRWQHIISAEVEARLVALLGDPATCPHGNRIPGSRSPGRQSTEFRLAAARPGPVTVARISEQLQVDNEALGLLARSHLIPGNGATVLNVSAETITVSTPHGDCAIPISVAEQVWASPG
jgi:DtxR family Mn-dependent transcriptional regulator